MNIFEAPAIQAGRTSEPTVCSTNLEIQDAADAGETWLAYLVFQKGKSNKFYELLGVGYDKVVRTNGRIGKKGTSENITYSEALAKFDEKIKKGYLCAIG